MSSFWVVGAYFALDLLGVLSEDGGVAYWAHIGGTIGGLLTALALLKLTWLKPTKYEHTVLDVLSGRSAKGVKHIVAAPSESDLLILHVHVSGGNVERFPAERLLQRERNGENVDDVLVSEDGKTWTAFKDFRRSHHV